MNYQFKTNVKEKEYQSFIKNNSAVSFMQEYPWGDIKVDWEHLHCGLYQDNKLVAVCLILIRTFPLGIKLFYIPRGYVIDFENKELVDVFTKEIKKLAKQYHAYSVKIDPNFCIKEYSSKELDSTDKFKVPTIYSKHYQLKNQNLLKAGFHHHKLTTKIDDSQQPRFNMSVALVGDSFEPLDDAQIKTSFKKRIREYLGNYHDKRGVFFEHTNDVNRIDEFMDIINKTEARQNIILRNKDYFIHIMKKFDAYLFFGKVNLEEYLTFLKQKGKPKEIEEVENLIAKGNKIINLSTALVILPKNVKGIRTSEYLYAGNDLQFAKLNVSYGLVYDICKFSAKQNCHFCNLGGVSGTLDDHLTTFKSRFNAIIWEFAGEYDLIIHPILYYPIEKLLPIAKKIYRRFMK